MYPLSTLIEEVYQRLQAAPIQVGQPHPDVATEARFLVLDTVDLPPNVDDDATNEYQLDSVQHEQVMAVLQQRLQGQPLAYLTNKAWFQGFSFYVDKRVIIPRSYLGELLVEQCEPWVAAGEVQHILDLCCGSACLAIVAAEFFPDAKVDAIDNSRDALTVAAINVTHYGKEARVRLLHSDLWDVLSTLSPLPRYDVILCNPPYVNDDAMAQLPPEYCQEPSAALAGGADGMALIRRIVSEAGRYLNPHGVLLLEIGNEAEHFVAAFPKLSFVWVSTATRDDAVVCIHAADLAKNIQS